MTEDSHKPVSASPPAAEGPSVADGSSQARSAPANAAVEDWLNDLLGDPLAPIEGVLQTAAVWRRPGSGELVVLKICDETPKSATDLLLLHLGRARAQAIVTTGKILRDEPDLDFSLGFGHSNLPSSRAQLHEWRRQRCGLETPARIVLLSSGRDLPLHHPALEGREVTIVTSAAGAQLLAGPARAFDIEVVPLEEPGLLSTLEWLESRDLRRITVEAGPSTSKALYAETTRVSALCLSTLQSPAGEGISPALQGGSFLTGAELHQRLQPVREARTLNEPEGAWSFQLWKARVG